MQHKDTKDNQPIAARALSIIITALDYPNAINVRVRKETNQSRPNPNKSCYPYIYGHSTYLRIPILRTYIV